MMNGVQFVIVDGTPLMLKWSADNLDMELKVHIHLIPHKNNYKYIMTDIIITINMQHALISLLKHYE